MNRSLRAPEHFDHFLEEHDVAVGELTRRDALARRGLSHLDAVLVGAGQEIDLEPIEPLEARQRIGRQRLIRVADMRRPVGVRNRGGDEEFRRLHRRLAFC